MGFDEAPDARADLVETEVRARAEIEDDGFAVELAKHDVVADAEPGAEG